MNYHKIGDEVLNTATDREREYIRLYNEHGSITKAGRAAGVDHSVVSRAIYAAKKRAGVLTGHKRIHRITPKILIIPDVQIMPNVDMKFLLAIGRYIVDKKPDTIICLGDFADMSSLCSYEKGKRGFEGKRYKNDVESAITGQTILWSPMEEYNKNRTKKYRPKKIMLIGNHEDRIDRATQLDPILFGTISIDDLKYPQFGWEVIPFLKVIVIDGIALSHYFISGAMGRACSSAQQQLNKMHMSCISGHQQGRQSVNAQRADGKRITSIIAGSSYDFQMEYLGGQGNNHWRGIIMLHNVQDGEFDEVYIPIDYLKRRYCPDDGPIYMAEKDLIP